MATRVGIDLSPAACRIVEVDAGPAWRRHNGETRVRSFAVLPPSGSETRAKLESLRKRDAAVVVWDGPSDHHQVVVSSGSYESMRTEALGALAAAGLQTRGVWADIAAASGGSDRRTRRPVVVALAPGSALASALQPLVDAGIRLRTVTTPAMALGSLARLRRAFTVPNAIEVYVALEEALTCITLVRGGVPVAARPLAWGYVDELDTLRQPRERDDIATRLADAIREFVATIGGSSGDIGQVCICGGLPELRSMTLPLMERLDVEVEPLDSLYAIDAAQLPEPADEFRERGAELRLAWAVATDWPAPINLLRARNRQASKTTLARAAVAAGVAAGLVVGWRVEQSQWWRSTAPKPVGRTAAAVPPRSRGSVPASTRTPATATSVGVNKLPVVTAPPVAVNKAPVATPPPMTMSKSPVATAPPVAVNKPAVATALPLSMNKPPVVTAPPVAVNKPAVATAPPMAMNRPPVVTAPPMAVNKPAVATAPLLAMNKAPVVMAPPVAVNKPAVATAPLLAMNKPPFVMAPPVAVNKATVARPPMAMNKPPIAAAPLPPRQASPAPVRERAMQVAPPAAPPAELPRPAPSVPTGKAPAKTSVVPMAPREPATRRARPTPPPEVAMPFDAVLGTILYSPDRKLAIVDGRIVGAGDDVRGARVVDITPGAVMLRDVQGRLRRLAVSSAGR